MTANYFVTCSVRCDEDPNGPRSEGDGNADRRQSALGIESRVPHHSTFSKDEHCRFRHSDLVAASSRRSGGSQARTEAFSPCDRIIVIFKPYFLAGIRGTL
jgi:hypothetical protein